MESKMEFNIQKFAEGAIGITKQEIEELYKQIHTYIDDELSAAIADYNSVREAIIDCWSGPDAEQFLRNFYSWGETVMSEVREYDRALKAEFIKKIEDWETFSKSNVKRL